MAVWDAVVIGGGAAGLFCAALAGQRGRRILVIDHSERIAEKIRISGGGRCNFTNRELDASAPQRHFLSRNPQFCRSALARYTPQDFIALLDRHGIGWHEKHRGQLFCDQGSGAIIDMLIDECARGAVERHQPCAVRAVRRTSAVTGVAGECFELDSDAGTLHARRLVVATGGLSIPQIGATDFGHRLARQFGLKVVEPRPALVPLTFAAEPWAPFAELAGLALPARVRCGAGKTAGDFREDLLFTHRGLSGPAILQISSYWTPGAELTIDLSPGHELAVELLASKAGNRKRVAALLAQRLPERLAQLWVGNDPLWQRPLADLPDKPLRALAQSVQDWRLTPNGSEGFRKAEVTLGGVDTRALSSQTLEARDVPGLHFIGEVVDVTGWLGGYNFQWAWASAHACALAL